MCWNIKQINGTEYKSFIASTNINKTVPDYLENGIFNPHPTKNLQFQMLWMYLNQVTLLGFKKYIIMIYKN